MTSEWSQFKDEEELWRVSCNLPSMEQSTAGDPMGYEESCNDEDKDSDTTQVGDEDGKLF